MTEKKLRIATRQSALALWQANYAKSALEARYPDLSIELKGFTTQGDKILDRTLSKVGGKGLFIKELEHALLTDEADLAIHCLKDVPYSMPDDLVLTAMGERASPFDAFVSNQYADIEALPQNAVVGTSSLRRQAQLLAWRPDITIKPLRGNIDTRLKKLDDGEFDAIVLAAAGLERMGWGDRIKALLPADRMVPAVGQGALCFQIRKNDQRCAEYLSFFHHEPTAITVAAERAMNLTLRGSCQVPIGGFCAFQDPANPAAGISLTGLVGQPDGTLLLKESVYIDSVTETDAQRLGERVAQALIAKGADKILAALALPESNTNNSKGTADA